MRGNRVSLAAALAVAGLGGLIPRPADAATFTWNNPNTGASSGNWSAGANWSVSSVPQANPPGAADIAVASNGGAAVIDSVVPTILEVRWANATSGGGTIDIRPGGSLTATRNFFLGRSAGQTGTLLMSGGSLTVNTPANFDTDGEIVIGDTANTVAGSIGVLTMTDGTITAGDNLIVADNWNSTTGNQSSGTVTQSGGVVNAQSVQIGRSGIATYTLSGAGVLNQLGSNPAGNPAGRDAFILGNNSKGVGTFNQNGGTVNVNGGMIIADEADLTLGHYTTGTYNITAGVLDMNGTNIRLDAGNSTFNLDGGTVQEVSAVTGSALGTATSNLNFNGGLITSSSSTSTWISGITKAYVKAGGALIDTNGHTPTVAQVLAHDPALGATPDGGLTKSGAGALILGSANTYTGQTTVTAGALIVGNTSSTGGPENYLTPGVANLSVGAAFGARLGSDGLTSAEFDNLQTSTVLFDANNKHLAAHVSTTGVLAQYDSAIGDVGGFTRGLQKYGSGTLVLTGTNTYTGPTTLIGGTLNPRTTASLPGYNVPAAVTVNTGTTLAVSMGGTGEWSGADVDTLRANATFTTGSFLGFDTTNATGDVTYASNISGLMGLSKSGAGTLRLTGDLAQGGGVQIHGGTLVLGGNNTYTGETRLFGGTLRVTSNNALGSTATPATDRTFIEGVDLTPVLEIDGTAGDLTIAEPLVIEGRDLINTTPQIVNVGGNNNLTAPLTTDAGGIGFTLQSNAGKLTVAGINNTITSPNTRQVFLKGAGDGEITGPIQNTTGTALVAVTKQDAGTWTLEGANTYAGGTTVSAGTLQVSRMHAGNAVTVAAGATLRVLESNPGVSSGHPAGNNASVSQPSTLTVDPAGFVDITNNDIVLNYTGATPVATYEALVRSAYNVVGDWQGPGITSSIAANDGNYVVAIADNATLAAPFGTAQGGPLFAGVDVDLDTVLIKFTHRADINLDGLVTPDDSAVFGGNYDEGQAAVWATGDMNYDGIFTPDDAAIFGGAYDESLASLPEPASLAALGLLGVGLIRRRRRH